MSKYARYSEYKDSGVPWLGEIPSHWQNKRLKYTVTNVSEKVDAQTSDLRYFGLENIQSFTGKLLSDVELVSEGMGNTFKKDDVLFGKLRPYLAKVYLAKDDGLSSTEALIFRATENIDPNFLFYFCLSPDFISAVNGTTFGSKMPRASWDDIASFKMVYPSLDEQAQIANFLDHELGKIDALIDKQQLLLDKLAEQRSAVITQAVTKGLNPNAEMKDSGVTWFDNIPSHWIVQPTKYALSHVGSGKTPKGGAEVYIDSGVIMIRSQNVHDTGLRLDDVVHITDEADEGQKGSRVLPNDILLNITGASIGRVSIAPEDLPKANVNQHVCILRPIKDLINPYFLQYYFQSHLVKSLIKAGENGTSREGLTFEQIKAIKIALPKLDEQNQIVKFIDQETQKIDQMTETVNRTIERLKEYRSTLITQAVTGKIKVF